MILPELRASAYKYATLALGVLAVALLIVALFLRGMATLARADADRAGEKARAAELRAETLSEALARDGVSDGFTRDAQYATDTQAAQINNRLASLERRTNDRPPVPTVCPDPDPVLSAELQDGAARFRAAQDRLRSLRTAEGGGTD